MLERPWSMASIPAPHAVHPVSAAATAIVAALAIVAAGCGLLPVPTDDPAADRDREIALHQAAWAERAIDSYTVSITLGCFCPPGATGPFLITVVDGTVTDVLFEGAPADPRLVSSAVPLTIDAVFERLRNLEPRATMTAATWDPDWGFPTSVSVDPIPNAIDDEFSITIASFEPADCQVHGGGRCPSGPYPLRMPTRMPSCMTGFLARNRGVLA